MRGNDVLLVGCLRLPLVDHLSEVELRAVALDDAPLPLLPEQLALEPIQLALELIDLLLRCRQLPAQTHHLLRRELSRFLQAQHARRGGRIHGGNYTIRITVAGLIILHSASQIRRVCNVFLPPAAQCLRATASAPSSPSPWSTPAPSPTRSAPAPDASPTHKIPCDPSKGP